jgi:hypothetical protein
VKGQTIEAAEPWNETTDLWMYHRTRSKISGIAALPYPACIFFTERIARVVDIYTVGKRNLKRVVLLRSRRCVKGQ